MKALTKNTQETNIRELIVKTSDQIRNFNFSQLNEIVSSLEKIKVYMESMEKPNERKHLAIVDAYAPVNNSPMQEVPGEDRILYFSGKY